MRPTTRRVTAQRKFAQGAFVPVGAAAAAAGGAALAAERREPANNDKTNIIHNNMQVSSLLDAVCFQTSHSHLQPIVLVERLRETNLKENTAPSPKLRRASFRPKVKRGKSKSNVHVMTLRSRSQRRLPQRSTQRPVAVKAKRSSFVEPSKSAPERKRKCQRKPRWSVSDFSVDDNRPLTYFAKCSNPKPSSSQPQTVLGPPAAAPPAAAPPPTPVSLVELKVLTPINIVGRRAPPETNTNVPAKVSNAVVPSAQRNGYDESQAGPSGLQVQVNAKPQSSAAKSDSTPVSYYSEQGIHRWMEVSMPEELAWHSATATSPMSGRSCDDSDMRLVYDGEEICPSVSWKTAGDVINAPKAEYFSRCTTCKQCILIEKHIKLSHLLKRQRRIECETDDAEEEGAAGGTNQFNQARTSTESSESTQKHYIELMPRHPHLLIKITVENVMNNKSYFACLIPRSECQKMSDFIYKENEELLEILIEVVSLSLGDPPPNTGPALNKDKDTGPSKVFPNGLGDPSKSTERIEGNGKILDAPVFWPTKEEFTDPIAYVEKIWGEVANYGICKIVPPEGFEPPCKADDDIRFEVTNQYISRLYNRWGPAAKELCAIKMCLRAQNINMTRLPVLDGVEVNLPKLYNLVQRHGGLETVINKKRWGKVAEEMKFNKNPFTERKLDQIYVRYLLPYDTLSTDERQELLRRMEKVWTKKHLKLLERATNPLHRKKILLGDSDSSTDELELYDVEEVEDCVKPGANMNLAKFKKVANNTFQNIFRNAPVNTSQMEEEYWHIVVKGSEHACVNTASIDTGADSLGFSKHKNDGYNKHPWNLKMISQNPSNVLRSMGPVLGVTVPTLHLGMIFSTSCWHRDPHCVAWAEFSHHGAIRIWYSVPEKQGPNLRRAMQILSPTFCQQKSLWLSSDIVMIPPELLRQHNVQLFRVEQQPGEYVVVMPRAYSCSISTGYTVSESVYFATDAWLDNITSVFKEIRESCEPTMFALEQVLLSIAEDERTPTSRLLKVRPLLETIIQTELVNRELLLKKGVTLIELNQDEEPSTSKGRKRTETPPTWNVRDQDECEVCRCTLYLSKVKHIPMKNSTVCLEHALQLLAKSKYANVSPSTLVLYCTFSASSLRSSLESIKLRLQSD